MDIQSIVRGEIQDFVHNPITVVQGYQFNQYENVKKIHLYENSRFYDTGNSDTSKPLIDGIDDEEKDDRIFFNVSVPRSRATKRFFNVNVGEILLDEIDPQNDEAIRLLNKDFKRFAEDNTDENHEGLAEELNAFVHPYVDYGSLVIEVQKDGKPEIVPLQNYFLDPTVERSKDSRFNTIKYTLTPKKLRDKAKEGWDSDAVEAIIRYTGNKSKATSSYEDDTSGEEIYSSAQIDVYKRYGWLPRFMIEGVTGNDEHDNEEIFTMVIVGMPTDAVKKGSDNKGDQVLYKTEWTDDLPIEDTHLTKTKGRWQGIGIIELLFPIQKRMNEVCNQKRISMELGALQLFQTADPTMLNNLITDLENGDVIRTKTPNALTRVDNQERNLSAYDSEIVTYQTQGDKLSFANDLLSGGDIASSTPATNAVIQNNNQVLVHLQDRQNFTNFIANAYLKRHVVPRLIKEMSDEHVLRIAGDPEDMYFIDEKIVGIQFMQHVKDNLAKGKVITELERDDIKQEMLNKLKTGSGNRYVKVLQDYYKKRVGDIRVIIGDEKKDMAKIAGNTLQFFNMLQAPEVLDDPVNRLFATQYGKEIGVDTEKLELAFARREAQRAQQPQEQQGGGAPQQKQLPEEKQDPALAKVM